MLERMLSDRNSHSLLMGIQNGTVALEDSLTVSSKTKHTLPYDPAIPLLGIYLEKTIVQKVSCTTMFIAGLFTKARTGKQPTCPLTYEWIKMWHIYTMEYYSGIKRNEIELFVVRWMDLLSVIQSEVSQKEKNKYRMLTHIYGILKKEMVLMNLGAGQE